MHVLIQIQIQSDINSIPITFEKGNHHGYQPRKYFPLMKHNKAMVTKWMYNHRHLDEPQMNHQEDKGGLTDCTT